MKRPTNTLPLDAYQRLLAQQAASERRARPRHKESGLQRVCVKWFRAQYPELALMLFAVPNGGARSSTEGAIMKGEGVTAGVADLILLVARGGWGALCIEMKTKDSNSRQSASQKTWQAAAEYAGNRYVVVRTVEEFQAAVRAYLGERYSEYRCLYCLHGLTWESDCDAEEVFGGDEYRGRVVTFYSCPHCGAEYQVIQPEKIE